MNVCWSYYFKIQDIFVYVKHSKNITKNDCVLFLAICLP